MVCGLYLSKAVKINEIINYEMHKILLLEANVIQSW